MFRFDPNFDENELLWEQIKKEILGDDDDEEDEEDGEGEDREVGVQGSIICNTSKCSCIVKDKGPPLHND